MRSKVNNNKFINLSSVEYWARVEKRWSWRVSLAFRDQIEMGKGGWSMVLYVCEQECVTEQWSFMEYGDVK